MASLANGKRTKKMWQETGDYDDAMWACAQSVGLINEIPSCIELIDRIVYDAEVQLKLTSRVVVNEIRRRSQCLWSTKSQMIEIVH